MNYNELLSSTQEQIRNCDNKASLLISAVGVVFGFSLFTFDYLMEKILDHDLLVIITGIMYLFSFLMTTGLLIFVIFPRGRNNKEKMSKVESPLYYEDIYRHVKNGDLIAFLNSNNEEGVVEQLSICSRIAHKKTLLIKISCFSIMAFVLSLIFFVVAVII